MSDGESSEKRSSDVPPSHSSEASAEVDFTEPEVVGEASAEAVSSSGADAALAEAKANAARFREQLLRTAADFDNFRKRTRRELEDATRRGKEQALKELLPVFDNVERAMNSAATAPDIKSVTDGLRMVNRQFEGALDKLGIKRIVSVGQPFDPSQHEAIQHVDSTEHVAGVIANEVQPGYRMGDYLLRAALVVVSKGPGGSAPTSEVAEGEAAAADPAPAAEVSSGDAEA
jgi:molecular chaperone GrpE